MESKLFVRVPAELGDGQHDSLWDVSDPGQMDDLAFVIRKWIRSPERTATDCIDLSFDRLTQAEYDALPDS